LFALNALGGLTEDQSQYFLTYPTAPVRKWLVRLLGDPQQELQERTAMRLRKVAETEPDLMVRSQLASTAKRLPAHQGLPIVEALVAHEEDAQDPHIPLLLWWAVEHHALKAPERAVAFFTSEEAAKYTIARETILPRLARRYVADASAAGDAAAVDLLQRTKEQPTFATVLAAVDEGLGDRRETGVPAMGNLFETYAVVAPAEGQAEAPAKAEAVSDALQAELKKLWEEAPEDPVRVRLAARLGHGRACAKARTLALDPAGNEAVRVQMVALLGECGGDVAGPLLRLVREDKTEAVRLAALDAVRRVNEPAVATSLLEGYGKLEEKLQARIREVLLSRPTWTRTFLGAVDAGGIKAETVPLTELRAVALHQEPELNALVEKHWGVVKEGTPEERLAEVRRLNNELRLAQGDPARGQVVFEANCGKCHTFYGKGFNVGPDLTQANRKDTEFMLISIVDPSQSIRKEYTQYIAETEDGGLYNGIMAERSPGQVTLLNANNERRTLPENEITELREADTSLMPDGILTPLPGDDIRDLFAFLQAEQEVKEQ
jgi:putative heme-binding domain-containing protein